MEGGIALCGTYGNSAADKGCGNGFFFGIGFDIEGGSQNCCRDIFGFDDKRFVRVGMHLEISFSFQNDFSFDSGEIYRIGKFRFGIEANLGAVA